MVLVTQHHRDYEQILTGFPYVCTPATTEQAIAKLCALNLEFMRYQVFLVATYTIAGKTPILSIIKGSCYVGQSKGIWFPSADATAPI